MDPHARPPAPTVSNLVPVWDDRHAPVLGGGPAAPVAPALDDGGGRFEPAAAAPAVEHVVEHGVRVERIDPLPEPLVARYVSPPEQFDHAEPMVRRSAYELLDTEESTWAEAAEGLPEVDYELLHRREIAKELLRARLVAIAERRERRSAYEVVFIMLAAAVSVLLAAPPLVQVLLAAHGQA